MKFLKNNKGFTLVEMISVILVVGIMGAVALPMFDTSSVDVSVAGNTVQADIQYTQELAMTRDQSVGISFINGATTYDVPADPNGVFPLETRELPKSVTIVSTSTTITFNSFGEKVGATEIVYLRAGPPPPGPPPPGPPLGKIITITIEVFTGRVTVS
ncbi:MAG: prepilin-type N-terminal cleavage/methylation domain-containing protein [Nitrospina sp.]|jgi:prepilin-type N-terminal cleavage/methylation domain-containing protein|nr:prepilin-type N-terminal cleavage/methylation domain-containing protein [Nitrospina sp.]